MHPSADWLPKGKALHRSGGEASRPPIRSMTRHAARFAIRLATTPAEVEAAQALRFRVFVEEMGAQAA